MHDGLKRYRLKEGTGTSDLVELCLIVREADDDLVRMMSDLVSERLAANRVIPDAVHRWLARTAMAASR
jgi:hypothetical protein